MTGHHNHPFLRQLSAALALSTTLLAQGKGPAKAGGGEASSLDMSGAFATAVCSQYYFRGLPQENQGFIVQPSLQLDKPLWAGSEHLIDALSLTMGVWNSLHSGPTGTGGGSEAWFESDFLVGGNASFGDLRATALYLAYASPNGSFTTLQETTLTLSYDDSALWPGEWFLGLQPSITFAQELRGQNDLGTARGRYLELGVTPGIEFTLRAPRPSDDAAPAAPPSLSLTLPIKVGFSLGDYFEADGTDDTFGFVDVAMNLSVPLPLPEHLGDWSLVVGVEGLWLGDNAAAQNGGDTFEVIGTVTAVLAF